LVGVGAVVLPAYLITHPVTGSTAPPVGLSIVNSPEIFVCNMGKGERGWEKGRGDDPFWDLSPDQLKAIERDPKSTPSQKERARRIRKQKEKDCS
jgi:hypothetical protein